MPQDPNDAPAFVLRDTIRVRSITRGFDAHAAPPPYVPMSGGAVTALVLAVVLLVGSLIGPPWCEAMALAIAALSLPAIRRGKRRGKGVAIAAIVLAWVGVGAGVMFQHMSNGGQTNPNPGIDALGFTFGGSWAF